MPKVKLTAKGLDSLTADAVQTDYWDALTPGLTLRVSGSTGRKVWYVRYRANGAHRRMKLGSYPGLSLADAREKARNAQTKADAGADPAQERQERKATDATFGAMAREVLDAKAKTTRDATRTERERILKAELLPHWKNRPAASITRRDVVHLVEAVAERGPTMANRTMALVKMLYNGALKRGFPTIESNPATMMDGFEEKSRRRFLETDEIRAVWNATEPEAIIMRSIFRLTLLTAQRVGSVCAMRWEDIDDTGVWTIPADVFKGRRPHAVPLCTEARAIIGAMPRVGRSAYLFPVGRADGAAPHITSTNKALTRIREASKLDRWTVHDFRRTFRTHATRAEHPAHDSDPAGLGVAPHVADAVLGHKEASLGFDKYTGEPERYLLAEKRDALEKWGTFVRAAVEAKP
jgi:integrase